MRRRAIWLFVTAVVSACAPKPPVVDPGLSPAGRLQSAEALVSAGCLDCLNDAFQQFDGLRADRSFGARATAGAIRTAVLIAIRENELGLVDSGRLKLAHRLLEASPSLAKELATILEVADVLAAGPAGQAPFATSESQTQALVRQSTNQARWATFLRERLPGDQTATYLWLSLACGVYGAQVRGNADRAVVAGAAQRTPLTTFKEAIACTRGRADLLKPILDAEPRYLEAHYFLGLAALGGQPQPGAPVGMPDLDLADQEFQAAYRWRQDWPSLTLLIANTALTAEDFRRALEFYDHTLAIDATHPDALLGKIRALTYMQRYAGAIAVTDQMLATGVNPGEARYWRALNEDQFGRSDEAWVDVQIANQLLKNADAPKLAGIIAFGRADLSAARPQLELSLMRRPNDCETGHYLELVLTEQREWQRAVQATTATASCFDTEEANLRAQIDALRTANIAADRRARQIARRERLIATNARMRAMAWYNAATANFNLGKKQDARGYAERLTEDEQFGSRARELLDQVR